MENKPWLKHYPDYIPHTIDYPQLALQDFLKNAAKKCPNNVAVHFMGTDLTYQYVYDASLKFAGYLQSIGINKGDKVAIMLPNLPQGVIAFFGVLMAGGVVVQTNPLYTERELEFQLIDSEAKAIVALEILQPRIMKIYHNTKLKHVIATAIKDFLPFPKNLIYPFMQKKQYGFSVKLKHEGNTHLFKEILKQPALPLKEYTYDINEDLALLQYTGGTTGFPKGVMLTHKNLVSNAAMVSAWLGDTSEATEKILGVIPLFHVYGLTTVLVSTILKCNTMILLPKFDVKTTLETIHKQKPTLFPGAPTIYIGILNSPLLENYDITSIRACLSGSAALPMEVINLFESKVPNGKMVEGYGLTETSPVTHGNIIWGKEYVKGSIGVPWPDTDAKIRSLETDEDLPVGEIGELVIYGPQVMKGYWNRPDETNEVLKDGWLYTGDIGYMDEDGYFYIVDRKKDMIIAGGFNIYPREIEEVLYEHPAIQEVVAAGVPDAYRGETVKVYIVLREGMNVTESELNTFCRKHLAAYKVPRLYEFRTDLPKTIVGKVLRRQLVEEERQKLASMNIDNPKEA